MEISTYSLFSAVFLFSCGLLIIRKLRCNTEFLITHSTTILLFLFVLSIIRVIFPLDLSFAYIIQSFKIFPTIQEIFHTKIYYTLTIGNFLVIIWILGTTFMLFKSVYTIIISRKWLKNLIRVENEQASRITEQYFSNQKIQLVVSPNISIPIVTGFFKAYIYIPLLDISDDAMQLILKHELQHIKNKDTFIKLFYIILKAIFWWNPIIHLFQQELENMLELRCDYIICKKINNHQKETYLKLLLNIATHPNNNETFSHMATLISTESELFLKQRFELLLNHPVKIKWQAKILSILLSLIVFIASYFTIIQPAYLPSAKEITNTIMWTQDNSYLIMEEDGNIAVYYENEFFMNITYEESTSYPFNKLKKIRRENYNE